MTGPGRSVVDGPSPVDVQWHHTALSADQVQARTQLFAAVRRRDRAAVLADRVRRRRRAEELRQRVSTIRFTLDPAPAPKPRRVVPQFRRCPAKLYTEGMVASMERLGLLTEGPRSQGPRSTVPRSTVTAGSAPDRMSLEKLVRF